ncbi:hypothetical protein ACH5RR_012499 [Cinchona calisaya]|uniref:Uncharacterized protein n=1 Tax=Cinchona calisaya TaxID=153742 RepID=A0ABD3A9I9_9GENT
MKGVARERLGKKEWRAGDWGKGWRAGDWGKGWRDRDWGGGRDRKREEGGTREGRSAGDENNIFTLDGFNNPTSNSACSSSSSSQSHGKDPSHGSKAEEIQSIRRETETSKSKGVVEEEIQEREESSSKDIALCRLLGQGDHPCHYIGLAKQAILKCFGLGYISESSRNRKHRKED